MPLSPADRRAKAELLAVMARIPQGRVATIDMIAAIISVPVPVLARLLTRLMDDERQMAPWHRVVAKGGAIGWGEHREAQFARLVREGVVVSPAGIVQDMERIALQILDGNAKFPPDTNVDAGPRVPQSRRFKERPG